jgi:hypothetical protein
MKKSISFSSRKKHLTPKGQARILKIKSSSPASGGAVQHALHFISAAQDMNSFSKETLNLEN